MSKEITFIPGLKKYPPNNFVTEKLTQFIQKDVDNFCDDLFTFLRTIPNIEEGDFTDPDTGDIRKYFLGDYSGKTRFGNDFYKYKIRFNYFQRKSLQNFHIIIDDGKKIHYTSFPFVFNFGKENPHYDWMWDTFKIIPFEDISKYVKNKNLTLVLNFIKTKIKEYESKFNSDLKLVSKELDIIDSDNNGKVDIINISDDLMKLLNKHQSKIISIDSKHIQRFIKLSNFLKQKGQNIQNVFDIIKSSTTELDKISLFKILKTNIESYEKLVFHSISMIISLKDDNLISFYEIYEMFDKLNVFNSNWENEVSNKLTDISDKLTDIGDGLYNLMMSIKQMEDNITRELNTLTYVTQESFKELNSSITNELKNIDSSIKFNNLITSIQTYQTYQINKNTKSLRK